jgi:hypothetical protein
VIAGLVLAALVLLAGTLDRTGPVGAGVLAVASVVWLIVNGPVEGRTLITVTRGHGLTTADLAGLAGLGLAAWRLLGRPRR